MLNDLLRIVGYLFHLVKDTSNTLWALLYVGMQSVRSCTLVSIENSSHCLSNSVICSKTYAHGIQTGHFNETPSGPSFKLSELSHRNSIRSLSASSWCLLNNGEVQVLCVCLPEGNCLAVCSRLHSLSSLPPSCLSRKKHLQAFPRETSTYARPPSSPHKSALLTRSSFALQYFPLRAPFS